jgi:hypothetical protein
MGLLDEADENVFKRHQDLCVNLNMDKDAADEAWQNYETIRQNYTLEVGGSNFQIMQRRRYYFMLCSLNINFLISCLIRA